MCDYYLADRAGKRAAWLFKSQLIIEIKESS